MSVEIKKKVKGNVSFGDTSKIQIEGIGTILISYKDGGHKLIDEVYYVPKLKSNILSLGQLLEKEYYIHMKNLHLWLRYSNNNLIAKVYMAKNRLFPLNLKIIDAKCLKANVQDDSWCWHMQFGHLNFEALKLWETRTWLMEFHQLTIPTSSVKLVFLEYMQGGVFRRRPHEEQLSHVNLFTWMYVDRLIHLLLVKDPSRISLNEDLKLKAAEYLSRGNKSKSRNGWLLSILDATYLMVRSACRCQLSGVIFPNIVYN